MIAFKPLKLSLWLFIGGVSFGVTLGWGWLIVLGVVSPVLIGMGYLLVSALQD